MCVHDATLSKVAKFRSSFLLHLLRPNLLYFYYIFNGFECGPLLIGRLLNSVACLRPI